MIDAATFASSYNAFWHEYTPTCEHFVRRLNLDGVERFDRPMPKSDTSRRALIAEYAFSLFVEQKKDSRARKKKRTSDVVEDDAWLETEKRLAPYVDQGLDLSRTFNKDESREINTICQYLTRFFTMPKAKLLLRPIFSGCGFVDASEGDVIFGKAIYEVKTVERRFRSSDLRQAITYAALNFSSRQFSVDGIGLFNPRRGQFCELDLEYVCSEISGRPAQDLLANIIQAISRADSTYSWSYPAVAK